MAVGIFVKVNPDVVNMQHLVSFDSGDNALGTAAYVLIGFGVFVLIVSAFGFFTACCGDSKKVFVIIYIAFLVIIFIGEFSGGISAAVFKGKIDKELPGILSKTFQSYQPDNSQLLTKAWDYVQTLLECCGSQNPGDYRNVNFTLPYQRVPLSCCKSNDKDPEHPKPVDLSTCLDESTAYDTNTTSPTFVYKQLLTSGCYDKLNSDIKSHLALIIGVGVGIGMLQLLGIVLACCICRKDKDDDY